MEGFLSSGTSVVLDLGNLKKSERDTARRIAKRVSADHLLIYLDVPLEETTVRHFKNQETKERAPLADITLKKATDMFEVPSSDEHPVVYNQRMDLGGWIRNNIRDVSED